MSYQKQPKCAGDCPTPYEQITSKKDGKVYNKCMTCENLVFPKSQSRYTGLLASGVAVSAPAAAAECDHGGDRAQKVVQKDGANKGRAYSVCVACQKDFKWEDEAPTTAGTATTASTAQTYSLPLTTLVQDIGAKLDALAKSQLEMQLQLQQQKETTNEQLLVINSRIAELDCAFATAGPEFVDQRSASVNAKRARK